MDSIWQYGGCMMNFIKFLKRVNWPMIVIIAISFTIWYYVIKLKQGAYYDNTRYNECNKRYEG